MPNFTLEYAKAMPAVYLREAVCIWRVEALRLARECEAERGNEASGRLREFEGERGNGTIRFRVQAYGGG